MYESERETTPGEFTAASTGAEVPAGASSTPYEPVAPGTGAGGYSAPGSAYPPPPPSGYVPTGQYPLPGAPATPVNDGLSDTAAGAIAYITIIPAILFLVIAPYNQRPFVKFHAFQCLGLGVTWFCLGIIAIIPILGWLVWLFGSLILLVVWVMSIVKASQGSALKLPVISKLASEQSGYRP